MLLKLISMLLLTGAVPRIAILKLPKTRMIKPAYRVGSSGGSAAAVVLELAPFALGTDTGGSIRQPASFTGCVGYKSTYGLVSRSGVVAMASSTVVIGVLARSTSDVAYVMDIMSGKDVLDSTMVERDEQSYTDLPY